MLIGEYGRQGLYGRRVWWARDHRRGEDSIAPIGREGCRSCSTLGRLLKSGAEYREGGGRSPTPAIHPRSHTTSTGLTSRGGTKSMVEDLEAWSTGRTLKPPLSDDPWAIVATGTRGPVLQARGRAR